MRHINCVVPADTGAGTALSHLSGRTLLQISNDIPNYAASATTAPAGTGESCLGSVDKTFTKSQLMWMP